MIIVLKRNHLLTTTGHGQRGKMIGQKATLTIGQKATLTIGRKLMPTIGQKAMPTTGANAPTIGRKNRETNGANIVRREEGMSRVEYSIATVKKRLKNSNSG